MTATKEKGKFVSFAGGPPPIQRVGINHHLCNVLPVMHRYLLANFRLGTRTTCMPAANAA